VFTVSYEAPVVPVKVVDAIVNNEKKKTQERIYPYIHHPEFVNHAEYERLDNDGHKYNNDGDLSELLAYINAVTTVDDLLLASNRSSDGNVYLFRHAYDEPTFDDKVATIPIKYLMFSRLK
jgi:hypothetical protein